MGTSGDYDLTKHLDAIFEKIANNQSAVSITKLVNLLILKKYDLTKHIKTIFQVVKDEQNADDMEYLVEVLLETHDLTGYLDVTF